jgi:hypothetical protein
MRDGPSESAYRSGFQTTFGGCGREAMVVSAEGKGPARLGQVSGKKRTERKPPLKCRNLLDDVKTAALLLLRDKASTKPVYGRSGIRHERWPELAMRRIGGTWEIFK